MSDLSIWIYFLTTQGLKLTAAQMFRILQTPKVPSSIRNASGRHSFQSERAVDADGKIDLSVQI
jgi:hypothetical protein